MKTRSKKSVQLKEPLTPSAGTTAGTTPSSSFLSPDNRSVYSGTSTGSRRPGLALHIQKQLVRDIENKWSGGILALSSRAKNKSHLLATLLDKRTESDIESGQKPLYGNRGDPVRVQIGKYVDRWKKLSRVEWLEKLDSFDLTKSSNKKQPGKQLSFDQYRNTKEESEESSSLSSKDESMPSVPTVTRTRRKSSRKTKKQEQPPIEEISTKPAGAPEEEDFSIITTTDISTGTMNDSVVPTQNIPVDMRHLWKTAAPFTIYTAENMKGGNEKFKGFIIEMKVDPHDVFGADDEEEGFPYQARVLTNDTIVIDAPLKGHQAMGGYDEAIGKMLNEKNEDDKVLLEAFQNGRVEFERAVAAHGKVNKMVYRLKFSGRDVELSAEALDIHPKNDTHVLQMEALPLSVPVVHLNSTPKKTTMVVEEETEMEEEVYVIDHFWAGNLIWRVADKSQSTRKAKGGKKGKSKTDAAAAMFGRMNISSPTTAQHHTTSSSRTNKEKSDRTSHSALVPTSNTAVSGNGNRKKQSSLLAAVAKGDGKKNKVKDDEGEKMINRLVAEGTELSAAASMELDDVLGKRNRGVDEDDGNDRTDDKAVYEADY